MTVSRVGSTPWYFTAIYASPDPSKRQELWTDLKNFAESMNEPWLLAGDFNETRSPSERSNSCSETNRRSRNFNSWIEDLELIEVEFSGPQHTWGRGLSPETRQSARLDRVLCNGPWGLRFGNAKLRHLPAIQSDHNPLFISPNGFIPLQSIARQFKFQATWLSHEKFRSFVEEKWCKNKGLMQALSSLATDLQVWNKEIFGNIFIQKRHLLARIAGVQSSLSSRKDRGLLKLEAKLRLELDEILHREELLWYQKSPVDWLCDGDRNTTYFHLSTLIRRWRNNIASIKDGDGNWVHEKKFSQKFVRGIFYFSIYRGGRG